MGPSEITGSRIRTACYDVPSILSRSSSDMGVPPAAMIASLASFLSSLASSGDRRGLLRKRIWEVEITSPLVSCSVEVIQ